VTSFGDFLDPVLIFALVSSSLHVFAVFSLPSLSFLMDGFGAPWPLFLRDPFCSHFHIELFLMGLFDLTKIKPIWRGMGVKHRSHMATLSLTLYNIGLDSHNQVYQPRVGDNSNIFGSHI
jgi:hypothetical protein